MCGSTLKKVFKYALPAAAIAAPFLAPALPAAVGLSAPATAAIGGGLAATGGRLAIGQEPGKALKSGLIAAGAGGFGAPSLVKGAGALGFGPEAITAGGTTGTGSLAAKGVTSALPDVGSTIPQLAEAGPGAGGATTLPSISTPISVHPGGTIAAGPGAGLPAQMGTTFGEEILGGPIGNVGGIPTIENLPLNKILTLPMPINISPGVDYIGPPSAGEGGASTLSPVEVDEGAGGPLSFLGKNKTLPILAGSQLLNTFAQKDMFEGLNEAQGQSYADYLKSINPPDSVKQARFREAKSNISNTATTARRRLSDTLAARGIRGRGTASPNAGLERGVMKAENDAYNQIFGQYNVPGTPPPVNYTPGIASLLGKNVSDIGTLLFLQELAKAT